MPTTKNIRLIKITANGPARGVLGTVVIVGLITAFYFLSCKIGFLPAGMCTNNNLNSNTPPLTPVPTEEAMDISAQPTQLPVCKNIPLTTPAPICGSVYNVGNKSYCGADGTAFRQFTYGVSGSVAEHIQKIPKGTPLESDPAGLCYWTDITPSDLYVYDGVQQYYNVTFVCAGPSETFIKITDPLGPESCEVSANNCPNGYVLETSKLETEHTLYCVPEGQTNKSASCGSGMFVDEQNSCCRPNPANSLSFECLDYQPTQNGFTCSHKEVPGLLKGGFTLPTCSVPEPERPRPGSDEEEQPSTEPEPTTCVPDAAGGGCP